MASYGKVGRGGAWPKAGLFSTNVAVRCMAALTDEFLGCAHQNERF
jgi:hypothetical protein